MLRKTKEKFSHIKEQKEVRVFSRGGQIRELNPWRDESLKPMKSEENPRGFRVQQIFCPIGRSDRELHGNEHITPQL